MNYIQRKQDQLGMNPSTAQHRLLKDILFKFVSQYEPDCYICGKKLTRETFSIEHKTPWLDSYNPLALFFDVESNISFSHLACNVAARRPPTSRKYAGKTPEEIAELERERLRLKQRRAYTPEKRSARYKHTGH